MPERTLQPLRIVCLDRFGLQPFQRPIEVGKAPAVHRLKSALIPLAFIDLQVVGHLVVELPAARADRLDRPEAPQLRHSRGRVARGEVGHCLAEQLPIPDAKGGQQLQGGPLRSIKVGEQPIDLLLLAAAEHLRRALLGRGLVVELGFQLQIEGHPSRLAEDLLQDRRLLDAAFCQEAPGVFLAELAHQVLLTGLAPGLVIDLLPAQAITPADQPEHLGQLAHQIHQPALPWLPPAAASAHP